MKRVILGTLLITVFSLMYFCNSVEPPPGDKPKLLLALEDVSCTETWIELTTTNLQLPATISLKQNNQTRSTINLVKADTLLYIDSLLPNQAYTFHTVIQSSNQTSNELNITTMDTTSHNFTFETWTFGEHSSSVLYDVAIIDENNIWAVGEIYMNDSLGQPDPNAYNAVHWDGNDWRLQKITVEFRGNMITPPLEGVFAFSSTDIWFVGSLPIHGDGENWIMYDLRTTVDPNLSLSKAWGKSSDDTYFVGRSGSIAHYSGPSAGWQKIESGTELNIYDIWGQQTYEGDCEILCIASNSDIFVDNSKILKIEELSVKEKNNEGLPIFISTIWFIPERGYFIAGDGLYTTKYLGEKWILDNSMPPYYKTGIRGCCLNDIFMVGAFGLLMHFNGFSWLTFFDMPYLSGSYGEVNIKGNTIACTGGLNDGQAILTIGRR